MFLILVMVCSTCISVAQRTDTLVIHFDFDKSVITTSAASTLDNYFSTKSIPGITRIELYGHCDHVGDHEYNDALSLRRVEQTKSYLLEKGISENLIVRNDGFGKHRPLNDNTTPSERLMNRRVELVIHRQATDTPQVEQQFPPEKKPEPTLTDIIRDTTSRGNIILKNLQFQPGRHFLLPQSTPVLDELYQVLVDNPTLEIEIQGHVCCTPDNVDGLDIDLNTLDLSYQRAKTIYNHLVERKINPQRLSYKGFGGSRKLYQLERDEFERQENRRVELKIIRR